MKVVVVILSASILTLLLILCAIIQRSPDDGVIGGATALCEDGSLSMSDERSGTCSHHGGVDRWLNDEQ